MKKGTYKLRDYIVSVAFIAIFIYSIFIEKYISDNVNKNINDYLGMCLIVIILLNILAFLRRYLQNNKFLKV